MAYCIDFTASIYRRQQRFHGAVLVLACSAVLGAGWGGERLYNAWSRPSLAQNLNTYQSLAETVEPLYEQWCSVVDDFSTIAPYYRLLWSENAVDFLQVLVQRQGAVPPALTPLEWHLNTGGNVELKYELKLSGVGKRAQLASAEKALQELAFPRVATVTWKESDLADIESLPITVCFQLRPATHEEPPMPCAALKQVVERVRSRRASVLDCRLTQTETVNLALTRLVSDMFSAEQTERRDWKGRVEHAIDPGSFLDDIEQQLVAESRPVPEQVHDLRNAWNAIARQRWPWRRSELDNDSLPDEIRELESIVRSDLPPIQLFQPLSDRIQVLRRALRNGYSERDVFDDGKAALRLESEVFQQVGVLPRISIERPIEASGFMLAEWELMLDAPKDSKDGFTASDVLAALREIGNMHAGFVVQSIHLHLRMSQENGLEVERLTDVGLLAVRVDDAPQEKPVTVIDGKL